MGKGVVDLVFFSIEEIFAVPEIQFALKNEGMKFFWIRSVKWVRFPELGLGCGSTGLDKFIDGCDDFDSICIFQGCGCIQSIIGCFVIYRVSK